MTVAIALFKTEAGSAAKIFSYIKIKSIPAAFFHALLANTGNVCKSQSSTEHVCRILCRVTIVSISCIAREGDDVWKVRHFTLDINAALVAQI